MRLVVLSDLHADLVTLGVSRLAEAERSVWQSVGYAIEHGADYWLFLGDASDPDSGGATFLAIRLLQEAALHLAEHKIRSVFIAGNHDTIDSGEGATTLTPLVALEKGTEWVTIAERPRVIWLDSGTALLALPYTSPSHAYDPGKFARDSWPPYTRVVVAAHLTPPGIHPGSEVTDHPRGREVAFPCEETSRACLRLCGHIHKRQAFDPGDGGPPIQIVGSPLRTSFSEEDNEPAFLEISI